MVTTSGNQCNGQRASRAVLLTATIVAAYLVSSSNCLPASKEEKSHSGRLYIYSQDNYSRKLDPHASSEQSQEQFIKENYTLSAEENASHRGGLYSE